GVEAEGVVGGAEVVVDRLRYADDVDAQLVQLGRHAEGVLAADRHERVDAVVRQVALDPLDTTVDLERVGPRGADDGPAARPVPAYRGGAGWPGRPFGGPPPAVAEPDELVAVRRNTLTDDGPDDRVEAGAVAATGEHADTHDALVLPKFVRLLNLWGLGV